jgi:hypothetical protein
MHGFRALAMDSAPESIAEAILPLAKETSLLVSPSFFYSSKSPNAFNLAYTRLDI